MDGPTARSSSERALVDRDRADGRASGPLFSVPASVIKTQKAPPQPWASPRDTSFLEMEMEKEPHDLLYSASHLVSSTQPQKKTSQRFLSH